MNAILPIGYVTLLEAAEMLLPAMYAGGHRRDEKQEVCPPSRATC
jgi:hypothetical protein